MRRNAPLILAATAIGALVTAWLMATPPFAAPDEASHYLRALSLTNGTVVGRRLPYVNAGLTPTQLAWATQGTTAVLVPPQLAPPGINCISGVPDTAPAGCLEATEVGNYQPLPYLLPAVALGASDDTTTALWLGRAASALQSLAFLVLALVLAWDGALLSLAGVLAAITPLVLFVASIINPNGLEIAASLALTCAVIRIARAPDEVPRWVRAALTVSGLVTLLAWQLGPVFVAANVCLALALLRGKGLLAVRESLGRGWRLPAAAALLALGVYATYAALAGSAHGQFALSPVRRSLSAGLAQLPDLLRGSVGVFGSLTINLPSAADWIWGLAIVLVGFAALSVSDRREQILLSVVAIGALAFPVLFYAWVYRLTGFQLQARYVIPIMAPVPVLAAELLCRRTRGVQPSRRLGWLVGGGVAVLSAVQLYAWWFNASTTAGRSGSVSFGSDPAWRPPIGWAPWTCLAILGAVMLLAAGIHAVIVGGAAAGAARP